MSAPTDAAAAAAAAVPAVNGSSSGDEQPVDNCTYMESNVNLLFDPNKVLLRRVFFLDPEKTKYISVGFYPARGYQPLVEIGSPKTNPIILTDQHVKTLSEHLPAQVDALWKGEFYNVLDGEFSMHSASPYNTAILTLGKKKYRRSMFIKLPDLHYLAYIFPMVENQLLSYKEAMSDVVNYVLASLTSTSYVEPSPNANKNILYYQLYEELKTFL